MSYYKFNIDELQADIVSASYREITSEGKGPMISKSFDLAKMSKEEPMCAELVKGDIISIYYEKKGVATQPTTEKQWLDGKVESLTEEEIKFCDDMIKSICIDNKYDHLNAPPSVDEQVESFIKEFFDEEEEKPLEKRDFLEEFFEELDEENK